MDNQYEELTICIRAGDTTRVGELLRANPELDSMESPLKVSFFMMALYTGKPEVAGVFLQNGHKTNLHEAAAWGDEQKVAQLLGENKTLVDSFSIDGFQALGLACFFDHEKVVEILLNSGAAVNTSSQNFQQVTPLHSAAAANNTRICQMLLDRGAQVNVKQQGDFTPLHAAAQNGNAEMVQLFLDHCAEVNARSSQLMTTLTMAKDSENDDVIRLLQTAGGVE